MKSRELRILCQLVVELTKLRQAECKHLSIENFAPELLASLVLTFKSTEDRIEIVNNTAVYE